MIKTVIADAESFFNAAAEKNRFVLYEHEVYSILAKAGIDVPEYVFLPVNEDFSTHADELPDNTPLVLKIVSEHITHKTEAGGVSIGLNRSNLNGAVRQMKQAVPFTFSQWLCEHAHAAPARYKSLLCDPEKLKTQIALDLCGFIIAEQIHYHETFGSEFIIGVQGDDAFGPVIMFAPGGRRSEFYANVLRANRAAAVVSAVDTDSESLLQAIQPLAITRALTGTLRGENPSAKIDELLHLLSVFQEIARHFSIVNPAARWHIKEFEINPFACSERGIYPLDAFLRFAPAKDVTPDRPLKKVKNLLEPETVGIVGISAARPTPAGTILKNLLNAGFSQKDIFIVHPKEEEIQGCRCFSSLDALREHLEAGKIDLFVVGIPAKGPPGRTAVDLIEYLITKNICEAILIISAGFDETEHGKAGAEKIRKFLEMSRSFADKGPVISGPNNLGNLYGRIDTRFTPRYKSGARDAGKTNVALICQSGAFMLTRLSNLAGAVNPKIAVSIGNQLDLTFSDYLSFLKNYPDIAVFGVYVEGFHNGDGLECTHIIHELTSNGKAVVAYKAGRTPEGEDAAKGHTASIAGNYLISERILSRAGAYVAPDFTIFQDMIKVCSLLEGSVIDPGTSLPRVTALSNAGFEKCSIGDNLYADGERMLALAEYTGGTNEAIHKIFEKYGLLDFIDIGAILDLTPIAGDTAYKEIIETVLADPNVDCGLISIVPETAMLQTLDHHNENFASEQGIGTLLVDIRKKCTKPVVVCVESGELYAPLVHFLEKHNIPAFRSVDTAVYILGQYMQYRIKTMNLSK